MTRRRVASAPIGPVDAWSLTRALSPRATVRVAVSDAYGQVLNDYSAQRRVDGAVPERPWALYLADHHNGFRLLAFDLDAKSPAAAVAAARDADVLAALLTEAGIEPVVCASGPTGGRHVWAALAEPAAPDLVATLARLARHLCPTLDIAPLTNPATGCVRPPGAPHRAGGSSSVLSGNLDALSAPVATADHVRTLTERIARLVQDVEPTHTLDAHTPLPLDDHARLYLPGPRRELAAPSAAALREDAASGDASAVLWRVLVGAAAARWRHSDVAALIDTAPGLEHVRTYRDRGQRKPRGHIDAARVLRRQWDKAVRYVATADRQVGDDPTFDARADAIATHVRDVQARADTAAGRWTRGGGPADRRVLDVLCVLALQAISASVEADTRRLGLLAGIGRETARTALLRLADDGWVTQAQGAAGPRGACWTLASAVVLHSSGVSGRSQADPRPAGAGTAERSAQITTLTTRTTAATHDLFTPGRGLGLAAGNSYARTSTLAQPLEELARLTGDSPTQTAHTLNRLVSAGVLVRTRQGWRRLSSDHRRAAAVRLDVDGRLDERARRYSVERELWAWWQAEDAWMRAPQRPDAKRRPGRGQLSLLPEAGTHGYGPHPRRLDGRLDWRAARRIVQDERGGRALRRRTADLTESVQAVARPLSERLEGKQSA